MYFLMEPAIVFVYKIDTQNYIQVSDLSESDQWETFTLNYGDDFETFNHEESRPLEGRSYWFRQEGMYKMVEEINQHIQKNRQLSKYREATDTVHIVSSESAAGAVRVALAPPKHVIGFPDAFSIGPLWKLDETIGQTKRNEWLVEHINDEQDDYVYQHKFATTLREIEDIPNQVPIHIWYGNNAEEQVGLRFFLYLLRDKTNEMFLMNATELYERYCTPGNQPISHTSQIVSHDLRQLLEKSTEKKPLTGQQRLNLQREWETLSQTKEVLRVWMNDEITGVPENHFDPLILQTIERLHTEQETKDFIQTGTVLGELLTQMGTFATIFFLEYRVRHLVYSGVLALKGIPKSMRHYRVKLRN